MYVCVEARWNFYRAYRSLRESERANAYKRVRVHICKREKTRDKNIYNDYIYRIHERCKRVSESRASTALYKHNACVWDVRAYRFRIDVFYCKEVRQRILGVRRLRFL